MNTISRKGLHAVGSLFWFITGIPSAFAAGDASTATVDEVTVTARRTSETVRLGVFGERSNLETPVSATGYTAAMILDQGARTTSEMLANDPSIRIQSAGDGNYDYFSVRGFSVASSVFSLNGLYGVLPWNTLAPEAVERFAVIR